MKVVLVTNGPAPYRIPALNELAAQAEINLHVVFCCEREPNRGWNLPSIEFCYTFLRERMFKINDRYIHNNFDVIKALRKLRPDILITTGFNPTHLYAFAYTRLMKIPHIAMTDGTYDSERILNFLHRVVRRVVFSGSSAFVCSSIGGQKLFASYGIEDGRCYRAGLCVENIKFAKTEAGKHGDFDFIFCGRMESVKNPDFALDVAKAVTTKLGRQTKILFVGTGSKEVEVQKRAALFRNSVEASFHGAATQDELPALYRSARVFLFPTMWDPWGVVANEACAAGLPVLISPHAGAAGELVLDGQNGYICELDVRVWASHAVELLTQPAIYHSYSSRSRALASDFTSEKAAGGILAACHHAAAQAKQRSTGSAVGKG